MLNTQQQLSLGTATPLKIKYLRTSSMMKEKKNNGIIIPPIARVNFFESAPDVERKYQTAGVSAPNSKMEHVRRFTMPGIPGHSAMGNRMSSQRLSHKKLKKLPTFTQKHIENTSRATDYLPNPSSRMDRNFEGTETQDHHDSLKGDSQLDELAWHSMQLIEQQQQQTSMSTNRRSSNLRANLVSFRGSTTTTQRN